MAAAAATTTLRVGCAVFANDFRHPAAAGQGGGHPRPALRRPVRARPRAPAGCATTTTRSASPSTRRACGSTGWRRRSRVIKGLWRGRAGHLRRRPLHGRGLDGLAQAGPAAPPADLRRRRRPAPARLAAREADIVGLIAAGAPEGGIDWTEGTEEALARKVGWVRAAAGDRFAQLELALLFQGSAVTDRPQAAAAELAPAVRPDRGAGAGVDRSLPSAASTRSSSDCWRCASGTASPTCRGPAADGGVRPGRGTPSRRERPVGPLLRRRRTGGERAPLPPAPAGAKLPAAARRRDAREPADGPTTAARPIRRRPAPPPPAGRLPRRASAAAPSRRGAWRLRKAAGAGQAAGARPRPPPAPRAASWTPSGPTSPRRPPPTTCAWPLHAARRALAPAAPSRLRRATLLALRPARPRSGSTSAAFEAAAAGARGARRPGRRLGRRSTSTPATCCRRTPTRTGRPAGARRCGRRYLALLLRAGRAGRRRAGEPAAAIARAGAAGRRRAGARGGPPRR